MARPAVAGKVSSSGFRYFAKGEITRAHECPRTESDTVEIAPTTAGRVLL